MAEPPHTRSHRQRRGEEEGHEDEQPVVTAPLVSVTHQYFKHQQQNVNGHCYQHGFEFHMRLTLRSVHVHVHTPKHRKKISLLDDPLFEETINNNNNTNHIINVYIYYTAFF